MKRILLLASGLLLSACTHNPTTTTSEHEANKELVVDFYKEVLIERNADAIDKYIGDTYIQHNPNVPDGKEPFRQFIESLPERDPEQPPSRKIVRTIAEDDLVMLHIHNTARPEPRGSAIVDIFRVEDDMIVEHWDVIQPIPEESANDNTMF